MNEPTIYSLSVRFGFATSMTWRPLYVPQFGQTKWVFFFSPQFGQVIN